MDYPFVTFLIVVGNSYDMEQIFLLYLLKLPTNHLEMYVLIDI